MTISEKLIQIALNEEKVYQAGYEAGYDIGYEEGTAIGNEQFAIDLIQGTASGEIRIPNGVTTIRTSLFQGTNINTIYLPNTLKSLQYHCLSSIFLDNIFFEEGTVLDSIDTWAFLDCNIDTLKLPDIKSVGDQSLEGIIAKKIIFGKYTGSIGSYACRPNIPCEYDFSQSTNIPIVADGTSFDTDTIKSIIVPGHLYNEWVNRGDWEPYKDYIISSDSKSTYDSTGFSLYFGPDELKQILDYGRFYGITSGVGRYVMQTDEPVNYMRIWGDGVSGEALAIGENKGTTQIVTGKYLIYAYRIPTTNTAGHNKFQVFVNTDGSEPNGKGDMFYVQTKKDGKWHVDIINVEEAIQTSTSVTEDGNEIKFKPNDSGQYIAQKLRFDWFNEVVPTTDYIDIAYLGMCDSLETARAIDPDYDTATFDATYLASVISQSTSASTYSTTVTSGVDNGMNYITLQQTTNKNGETIVWINNGEGNNQYVIPNTPQYIGIMYRNAPNQQGEIYTTNIRGKAGAAATSAKYVHTYITGTTWNYELFTYRDTSLPAGGALRNIRFDFVNAGSSSAGIDYSIDIGFIKFFESEEQANTYFAEHRIKHNIV